MTRVCFMCGGLIAGKSEIRRVRHPLTQNPVRLVHVHVDRCLKRFDRTMSQTQGVTAAPRQEGRYVEDPRPDGT